MLSPALLQKFFLISSVILILSGTAQVFVRPRKPKESAAEKFVNRATITAVISLAIGVLGLLLGLGVLPMPRVR
ncbi:MAG TPA: hypothetical protein VHJ20_07725 [Polyangia bacterium]|nr:hypothetical protein [Polyangia bacterium]